MWVAWGWVRITRSKRNWGCGTTTAFLDRVVGGSVAAAPHNCPLRRAIYLLRRCWREVTWPPRFIIAPGAKLSPMLKIIVIIGAPGAGKGTQSRLLSEKYGYPQISTGDILREMAQAGTPLGRKIKAMMASGKLVSDEILAEVILARTSQPDCEEGYILDGYPRTLEQARLLEELARKQRKSVVFMRVGVRE